jgi:hypothetical protein
MKRHLIVGLPTAQARTRLPPHVSENPHEEAIRDSILSSGRSCWLWRRVAFGTWSKVRGCARA